VARDDVLGLAARVREAVRRDVDEPGGPQPVHGAVAPEVG
jgi:hypothetical protein